MIRFGFNIDWPYFKEMETKDYFFKDKKISEHKNLEIQISKMGDTVLGFEFRLNPVGQDHGGISIQLELWRRFFCIQIYDSRHWNYEEKRWYRSDEDPFE